MCLAWEACRFLNGGRGEGERDREEGGGLGGEKGRKTGGICKINEEMIFKQFF